jgi:membrane associated rhomboid family serine protease
VRQGEWWRLATHPFAHVTWYHLLLDAAALLLAYAELGSRRGFERLGFVIAAGAGSLLVAWGFSPLVATNGLGGLSGIAHGLTAVVGLEMLCKESDAGLRIAGLLCFLSVVGKSLIEAVTCEVLFASWHLGSLGTPVAVSHAGGVLGALAAVWLLAVLQNRRQPPASHGCSTPVMGAVRHE